ncbi:MAG: SDR family oxidoreductase [Deltaproteobacteria bacterium]|nr:SDR family oxidoreductase [Deltaproteobacteria bacterium]
MGKVALITGGARGIGRQIGEALARQGSSVAVCYRTSEEEGRAARAGFEALGARAMAVRADVSRPEEAQTLAAAVAAELGPVEILVHAAGPYHRVNLLEETVDGWNAMFANNLHSLFYMIRAVAPAMIERRHGRILAFGMANADKLAAQTEVTAHYLAKAGILGLVRSYAKALAKHGITVNAISPGFIQSGSAPGEELEKMKKNIPAGYVGSTDDAVAVATFLLSDAARYVNGTNVHLSGAWGV